MPYLVAWLLEPRQQDYFLRSYLPFDAFTPLRFVVAFSGFVPPLCFGQKLITPLLTIVGTKDDIVFTDRSESLVTRSFHVDEKSHEGGQRLLLHGFSPLSSRLPLPPQLFTSGSVLR
jgi:fermentation-respiration switch protein FrsA (DUF1100 family)